MFECHNCKRVFKQYLGLKYHLEIAKIKCTDKNVMVSDKGKKSYKCDECENTYSRYNNLKVHKEKTHSIIDKEDISDIKKELEDLKELIKNMNSSKMINSNNTTNNTTDNSNNTTNNTVNVNNNIVPNKFGKENISYIKNSFWKDCLEKPYQYIPRLIGLVNFDKEHPENHNIVLINKNKGTYKVFKEIKINEGEYEIKWIPFNNNELMKALIENNTYKLENHFEKNKDDPIFGDISSEKLEELLDKIEEDVKADVKSENYKSMIENIKKTILTYHLNT